MRSIMANLTCSDLIRQMSGAVLIALCTMGAGEQVASYKTIVNGIKHLETKRSILGPSAFGTLAFSITQKSAGGVTLRIARPLFPSPRLEDARSIIEFDRSGQEKREVLAAPLCGKSQPEIFGAPRFEFSRSAVFSRVVTSNCGQFSGKELHLVAIQRDSSVSPSSEGIAEFDGLIYYSGGFQNRMEFHGSEKNGVIVGMFLVFFHCGAPGMQATLVLESGGIPQLFPLTYLYNNTSVRPGDASACTSPPDDVLNFSIHAPRQLSQDALKPPPNSTRFVARWNE